MGLFATNRNRLPDIDGSPKFGSSISNDISYGYADCKGRYTLEVDQFSERIQAILNDGGDVLNFVHGFNANFETAITKGLNVAAEYGESKIGPRNIVVLSWPSLGSLCEYEQDKENAGASKQLARVLEGQLNLQSARRSIHLHCQSFGNIALTAIAKDLAGCDSKLAEVVMTAPALPANAFTDSEQLQRLPDHADRITVYYNPKDYGQLFQWLVSGSFKMQQNGPVRETLPGNVFVVNAGKVLLFHHGYYLSSGHVIEDILATLDGAPADSPALKRRYIDALKHFELIK